MIQSAIPDVRSMNTILGGISILSMACAMMLPGMQQRAWAQPVFSDFSFGAGEPFGGATTLGGVDVTLVTANTTRHLTSSFRDRTNIDPAPVTFTFSTPITEFHLDVSRVRADELLTGFNIGDPTSFSAWEGTVPNTLVNVGGNITTAGSDDFGLGRLSWTGIDTTVVSFTIWNVPNPGPQPALAIDQFGIVPIPEPSTLVIAICCLGVLTGTRLIRRRSH